MLGNGGGGSANAGPIFSFSTGIFMTTGKPLFVPGNTFHQEVSCQSLKDQRGPFLGKGRRNMAKGPPRGREKRSNFWNQCSGGGEGKPDFLTFPEVKRGILTSTARPKENDG